MRNWILPLAGALCICCAGSALADEPHIIIKQHTREVGPGGTYFDTHHNDKWAAAALAQLGVTAPANATAAQLAELTYAELGKLPQFGQKSTAGAQDDNWMAQWVDHVYGDAASGGKGTSMVQPIPAWFLEGYERYKGASVQRSRYLNAVGAGTLDADKDIAALYAYWSLYDAEWFSLSRTPGFKAWLSAVALTYPPAWLQLQHESKDQLHSRLVAPLQTPDEPYREIDNWIGNFKNPVSSGELGAFIKPKVRDALVQELLASAGLETDARFYEQRAYRSAEPNRTGLSEKQFFLLGALTLEYFQEIYAAHPDTQQPLYFREFFVSSFRAAQ